MSGNMILRVAPELLEGKAEEFETVIKEIQGHFDRIQSVSVKTKGYWVGDAGNRDRENFASYQEDISFIVRRLKEHPTDLLSMAGIYRSAEKDVVSTNVKLKINEIV